MWKIKAVVCCSYGEKNKLKVMILRSACLASTLAGCDIALQQCLCGPALLKVWSLTMHGVLQRVCVVLQRAPQPPFPSRTRRSTALTLRSVGGLKCCFHVSLLPPEQCVASPLHSILFCLCAGRAHCNNYILSKACAWPHFRAQYCLTLLSV